MSNKWKAKNFDFLTSPNTCLFPFSVFFRVYRSNNVSPFCRIAWPMLPNIRMTDFRLQLFYNKVQQASKGMSHKMILDNLLCVCDCGGAVKLGIRWYVKTTTFCLGGRGSFLKFVGFQVPFCGCFLLFTVSELFRSFILFIYSNFWSFRSIGSNLKQVLCFLTSFPSSYEKSMLIYSISTKQQRKSQ